MTYFTHAFGEAKSMINPDLTNDLHYDLTFSQWARRGWTFQEDAMAGARIVFGALGVYFGRDNEFVSEDGAAGFVVTNSVTCLQTNDELHRAWENVIHRYSGFTASSFTNPTDTCTLPALSGLARLYGNRLRVGYVAGRHFQIRRDVKPYKGPVDVSEEQKCESETIRFTLNYYLSSPYAIPD